MDVDLDTDTNTDTTTETNTHTLLWAVGVGRRGLRELQAP